MAKFLAVSPLTDVRGTLGALVFKMSRYGPVVYPRTGHRKRGTTQTGERRRAFSFLSNAWKDTLTQSERDTWTSLPPVHPWKRYVFRSPMLPGYNRYLQYNLLRRLIRVPLFVRAPASPRRAITPYNEIISQVPNKIPVGWSQTQILADQDGIVTVSWPFQDSHVSPRVWSRQTFHTHGPKVGWETYRISQPYLRPSWVEVRLTLLDDNLLQSLPYVFHLWCPA